MKSSLARLHQLVINHYNLDELQELCFDLGIEYENLGGKETRDAKTRGLLLWAGKRQEFDQLLSALQRTRPKVFSRANWGAERGTLEALYADLNAFEASTRPPAEKILRRLGLEQRAGLALLGVLVLVVAVAGVWFLYQSLRPRSSSRMSGDFRIAVAGFAQEGQSEKPEIGTELAQGVYLRLEETFAEIDLGFTIGIWGPERVGTIKGQDAAERAKSAAQLAQRIGADVVVYGWVDASGPVWQVVPEFYVEAENFYEAQEITGQHDIGSPLSVMGQGTIAARIEVSEAFTARAQALAQITVGLAFYSVHNYEQALAFFQAAEAVEGWEEEEGKQVLYLLIGNAAARGDKLDDAEQAYKKALEIDPEYSRAYLGLGTVYYGRSLVTVVSGGDLTDANVELLQKSIDTYELASKAHNVPPLSDTSTKVAFGLGQCYTMMGFSLDYEMFNLAVPQLEMVIKEYDITQNSRIRILAGEAHARLGLIYAYMADKEQAIEEFNKAVELLNIYSERRQLYQDAIRELKDH